METKASDILLSLEGYHLEVWKSVDDAICVSYRNADVKDGPVLVGVFGKGGTFEGACYDYLSKIRGKTLVFDAYLKSRKEIQVLG